MSVTTIGDLSVILRGDPRPLESAFSRAGLAVAALGGLATRVGRSLTGMFDSVIDTAATYETAITNTAAVTGRTWKEFDKARLTLAAMGRELGERTVFTASQAALAMEDLARKGFDPVKLSADQLQPILDLAAATQTDLSTATETATSAIRIYGKSFDDTTEIADLFTNATTRSNLTIEKIATSLPFVGAAASAARIPLSELTATLGALSNRGIPATIAATGLRRALAEMLAPGKKLKEALDGVGLSVADIDIKSLGLTKVIKNLANAGFSASDALESFGQRAGPVIITLTDIQQGANGAADEISALEEEFINGAGAATVASQQLDTYANQSVILESKLESLRIEMATNVLPVLQSMKTWLADAALSTVRWANAHPTLTRNVTFLVGVLGGVLGVVGPLLVSFGLLEIVMKAAFGVSMVGWISSVGGLVGILTSLGTIALALPAWFVAWKFGEQIGQIKEIREGLQALFRTLLGASEAVEEENKRLDAALQKRINSFHEFRNALKDIHNAETADEREAAVERFDAARDNQAKSHQARIAELQEDLTIQKNHFSRRLTILTAWNREERERVLAEIERIEFFISQHVEAVELLYKLSYQERLKLQQESLQKQSAEDRASMARIEAETQEFLLRTRDRVADFYKRTEEITKGFIDRSAITINDFKLSWTRLVDEVKGRVPQAFIDIATTIAKTVKKNLGEQAPKDLEILAGAFDQMETELDEWAVHHGVAFKIVEDQWQGQKTATLKVQGDITSQDEKFFKDRIAWLREHSEVTKETIQAIINAWVKSKDAFKKFVEDTKKAREKHDKDVERSQKKNLSDYRKWYNGVRKYLKDVTKEVESYTETSTGAWKVIEGSTLLGTQNVLRILGNYNAEETAVLNDLLQQLFDYNNATKENLQHLAEIWMAWVERKRGIHGQLLAGQAQFNSSISALLDDNLKAHDRYHNARRAQMKREREAERRQGGFITGLGQTPAVISMLTEAVKRFSGVRTRGGGGPGGGTTSGAGLRSLYEFDDADIQGLWDSLSSSMQQQLIQAYIAAAEGTINPESMRAFADLAAQLISADPFLGITAETLAQRGLTNSLQGGGGSVAQPGGGNIGLEELIEIQEESLEELKMNNRLLDKTPKEIADAMPKAGSNTANQVVASGVGG